MAWNNWLTIGMVMLAIGVILFIIGIVWYEINIRNRTAQNMWTYVFLIGGAAIGVVGCISIAIGLIQSDNETKTKTKVVEGPPYMLPPYNPQQVQQGQMPQGQYVQVQQGQPSQTIVLPPVVIPESEGEVYMAPPKIVPNPDVGYKVATPPPSYKVSTPASSYTSSQFVRVNQTPATTTIQLPPLIVDAPVIEDDPEKWT